MYTFDLTKNNTSLVLSCFR